MRSLQKASPDNIRASASDMISHNVIIPLLSGEFCSRCMIKRCSWNEKERGPEVLKLFFMLNSTEHVIFPAHKCENASNCWHFNIYEQEKIVLKAYLSLKNAEFLDIFKLMSN